MSKTEARQCPSFTFSEDLKARILTIPHHLSPFEVCA